MRKNLHKHDSLVMCRQIISRLITINLVSDSIYHGLLFKTNL
jgi:hypothetical protein